MRARKRTSSLRLTSMSFLKVPTGGGKTLLGVEAVRRLNIWGF